MYDSRSLAEINHQVTLIASAADRPSGPPRERLTGYLYLLAEDLVGRYGAEDEAAKARIRQVITRL